ncbi:hypothetical protein [Steroidobacter sp.]|uniref:hypothetical protein n=1 Tax=Steroidobacter sp. TaxID=1978227 RepID=UPI001A5DEE28|nr:hypothetical protein [Steroidobacter sp.]MBL8265923.1 hypothetical protein [Steroidobacter sp.]
MLRKLPARGAVLCSLLMLSGLAQSEDGRFGFTAEADLEYGGDDIATFDFDDGTTQDVTTGQGVTVAIGGYYRWADSPLSLRSTVGYKYVTTKASNADISVSRVVLEAVGNYQWDNGWWVGAGLTHHSNIKFDADGFGPNADFDDAFGPTVELGWRWIGLSYTNLDYEDEWGGEWDASNFGLTLTARF